MTTASTPSVGPGAELSRAVPSPVRAIVAGTTLAQVKIGAGGALSINGRDIPNQGVRLDFPMDGIATVTVQIPVIELDDIEGQFTVAYVLNFVHATRSVDMAQASGPSMSAALRALADQIEGADT